MIFVSYSTNQSLVSQALKLVHNQCEVNLIACDSSSKYICPVLNVLNSQENFLCRFQAVDEKKVGF